ncbi:MAG: hypothetical protein A3J35_01555 [Gammaproteobacteria bacterium RIFCSPLOWO2_02_FULL_52_10]|nr:MAG: hypothetical protein A3J35_01555 [Gammaproteobacteria bacterium RIFCSPLOWO2_02_FULL_52_10]
MVIWHISDGRRGHDNQCQGLVEALQQLRPCNYYKINHSPLPRLLSSVLRRRYPANDSLPDPDLIIGAGHDTHASILCAKLIRGGRTVVLMQPSLPVTWFDLCLIPAHDKPRAAPKTIITEGALTGIAPGGAHDPGAGLMLIGGPSRHHRWDPDLLLTQINSIADKTSSVNWLITDSPRTPTETSQTLGLVNKGNVAYVCHRELDRSWMLAQLARAGYIWITVDSVSMIYEALTAGAAVGLLEVPVRRRHRITQIPVQLQSRKMVTLYQDWNRGAPLTKPATVLNESARCAEILLRKFAL